MDRWTEDLGGVWLVISVDGENLRVAVSDLSATSSKGDYLLNMVVNLIKPTSALGLHLIFYITLAPSTTYTNMYIRCEAVRTSIAK